MKELLIEVGVKVVAGVFLALLIGFTLFMTFAEQPDRTGGQQ